jgi:hypothetical protein
MTTTLEEIIATVNTELPRHGRGILRPSDMARTGSASCFGRIATIGSALHASGVPGEALTLLTSRSHALEFKAGRCWLGHTALVLHIKDEILVDAPAYSAHTDDLGATTWPGATANDNQIEVVDEYKMAKYTGEEWDNDPYLSYIYGTREVYNAQPLFTAHPLIQGIELYQRLHPELNASPRVHADDYAVFYDSLLTQMYASS